MATIIDLGQKVKQKYPGTYDDLPDEEVGRKVKQKYPSSYDDFTDVQVQSAQVITPQQQEKPTISQNPLVSKGVGGFASSLGRPFATARGVAAIKDVEESRMKLADTANSYITMANKEVDPARKQKLFDLARQALQQGSALKEKTEEITKQTPQSTSIGKDIKRIGGQALQTAATFTALGGPVASGALFGIGSALEEDKPLLPEKVTPSGVQDSILGRGATYALGGKILGSSLNAVANTSLGQRILSSPVAKTVSRLTEPFFAKNAAQGTIGASVDSAFREFNTTLDKLYTPSTYTRPVGKVLRPVGEAVGILRTPEQQIKNAEQKIENYWNGVKQRYQATVRYDKNSPNILAREGITPEGRGGAMITGDQERIILAKARGESQTLDNLLESTGAHGSLEKAKQEAIRNVVNNFKGTDRQVALRAVEREFEQLAQDYGGQIVQGVNGERMIPLKIFNEIKSHFWSGGYPSKLAPKSEQITARAFRSAGNAVKRTIENVAEEVADKTTKEAIINLNNRLGELYDAAHFLNAMNGKRLPFGAIGRHFAQTAGAIIGSQGGAAGSLVGALTADKIIQIYQNPKYSVGQAAAIIARAKQEAPAALAEAERIIQENISRQSERLKLPKPSFIEGQPYKGGQGGVNPRQSEAFSKERRAIQSQQEKEKYVFQVNKEAQASRELQTFLNKIDSRTKLENLMARFNSKEMWLNFSEPNILLVRKIRAMTNGLSPSEFWDRTFKNPA